jgi:hypothetical protein
MSLSATLFGRDSAIFKATNILGLGIPGWLDKKFGAKDTEGPRLSDLSVQTSTYGADIPRVYGTISIMGNVMQLENNRLKETVRKKKSGGKGGGGSSEPTQTYSYSATFQLGLCEGPIAGVRRIWCGDKLIYNAGSNDLETVISSNKAAEGWRLYLGTDDQMPDPRYEAEYGAGNVSAHRGLAYISFYDFQLSDYSNTLQGAQFKVEIVSLQSTRLLLIDEVAYSYAEYTSNISFPARTNYIDVQVVQFYVPLTASPVNSAFCNEVRTNSIIPAGVISSTGSGNPPNYKTDVRGEFVASKSVFFSGGGSFSGPDGHIQRRNNFVVGFSVFSGRIYYKPLGSVPEYSISDASVKAVALEIDGSIYAVRDSSITKYELVSGVIVQTESWVVSLNLSSAGYCRAWVDGGVLYVRGGQVSSYLYSFDPRDGSVILYGVLPALSSSYYSFGFHVEDGVVVDAAQTTDPKTLKVRRFILSFPDNQSEQLSSIISDECALSGIISSSDLDVSLVTQDVLGYRVSGGSLRGSLEPLQRAFHFDVRSRGYKIQFLPRSQSSLLTIPESDLAASVGEIDEQIFKQGREMDTQLPASAVVKYLDASREYAIAEQRSGRLNTEAVGKVEIDLPVVLGPNEASGIAEVLNFLPWLERTVFNFTLPPKYLALEPSDVVTVPIAGSIYELRLTEKNESQNGIIECTAVPSRAALYDSSASGGSGVPPSGIIGLSGESLFIPLDIPVIDESTQNATGIVGVMTGYTSGWPGGILVSSNNGGQTWSDIQAFTGKGAIGVAINALPSSNCTLIDRRTLSIGLISGEFESLTIENMLAGSNYAAYGVAGRWEIVRFQNSAQQVDGRYLLSGFVRGEKGTEWATGLHVAGDYFILLDDPDNAFIGLSIESIQSERLYRAVTSGRSLDESLDIKFTYRGVNLECLSPVYARGLRDGSSNFSGSFTRRSRLSSSWWTTGVQAPVGEASEKYEIDVMSGASVVRTISTASTSFSYSAANQTADFGSAQSSITFRIYQLSELVGRGYPLETTL